MRHPLLSVLVAMLLGMAMAPSVLASPAHADTIDVTCEGGFHTVKWTPALIFDEREVQFVSDGGYGGTFPGSCTFADATAESMTFHMAGEAIASCASGGGAGNLRISWENGETSFISPLTVDFAPNPNGTGLALIATGNVREDGGYRFAGASVHATFTQAADPTACSGSGIEEASGPCPQLTISNGVTSGLRRITAP